MSTHVNYLCEGQDHILNTISQSVWVSVCVFVYLFEGVACNGLESLVYIDGLFGTCLKVGNAALALTPRLGTLCCDLLKKKKLVTIMHKTIDIQNNRAGHDAIASTVYISILSEPKCGRRITPSHLPVCFPGQSCCLAPQTGSSLGRGGWPGSGTRPSSCPESWRCWVQSRHTPGHSSQLRGRTPRPGTGTSPDLPCPRSDTETERKRNVLLMGDTKNSIFQSTELQTSLL